MSKTNSQIRVKPDYKMLPPFGQFLRAFENFRQLSLSLSSTKCKRDSEYSGARFFPLKTEIPLFPIGFRLRSGAPGRASGAPYLRKFGNPSISKIFGYYVTAAPSVRQFHHTTVLKQ